MKPGTFDEIYQKVKPLIEKKNTNMRNAISAHARLCITLRFLASGASYRELMYALSRVCFVHFTNNSTSLQHTLMCLRTIT